MKQAERLARNCDEKQLYLKLGHFKIEPLLAQWFWIGIFASILALISKFSMKEALVGNKQELSIYNFWQNRYYWNLKFTSALRTIKNEFTRI